MGRITWSNPFFSPSCTVKNFLGMLWGEGLDRLAGIVIVGLSKKKEVRSAQYLIVEMLMEVCSGKGLWRMVEDLHMGWGGLFFFSLFEVLMGGFYSGSLLCG